MIRGKRGEELTTPIIMILILDIMVFVILFLFVAKASSGALIYESVYAKEIAFFIDGAKPGTDIQIDFSKAIEIAETNGLKGDALKKLVQIDREKNLIRVSLRGDAGKEFYYFSDYLIEPIDENGFLVLSGNNLVLRIREVKDA